MNPAEAIIGLRASLGMLMQIVARQDPALIMMTPQAPVPDPAFSPLPTDLTAARQEQIKVQLTQ